MFLMIIIGEGVIGIAIVIVIVAKKKISGVKMCLFIS